MSDLPNWIEYLRALGPVLIGLFVLYIAFEQWRLAKANFSERLFDRRFELIELFKDLAWNSFHETDRTRDLRAQAIRNLQKARYLFSYTFAEEMDQLINLSLKKMHLSFKQQSGMAYRTEKCTVEFDHEETDATEELIKITSKIDELAEPFMRIDQINTPTIIVAWSKLQEWLGISIIKK